MLKGWERAFLRLASAAAGEASVSTAGAVGHGATAGEVGFDAVAKAFELTAFERLTEVAFNGG